MLSVAISSRWAGAVGLAQEAAKWNQKPKQMRQEAGAGGNAAREGGRDACAGRSARSVVVRHLKVSIWHLTSPRTVSATMQNNKLKSELFCAFRPQTRSMVAKTVPDLSALSPAERSAMLSRSQSKRDRSCPCAMPRRTPVQLTTLPKDSRSP